MKALITFLILLPFLISCSGGIDAEHNQSTYSVTALDSMPESEINVPIQIDLKPIFSLVENKVDTVFSTPNWPEGWVEADCATRYKYFFHRSPFSISASGNELNITFTGNYKMVGATRVCIADKILSIWTPPCKCGFTEGDRQVKIGFKSRFNILPRHSLSMKIDQAKPIALNKCTICFWQQDITAQIMKQIQVQLDLARKTLQDSFRVVDLKPYLQKAWDQLNDVFAVGNLGYFSLYPRKIYIQNMDAKDDLLNINIGITATPLVSFEIPEVNEAPVPELTPAVTKNNFNIYLDAVLQYDSLSKIVNQYLKGKRFNFQEGFIKKYVVIQNCQLSGNEDGRLKIKVDFSGSHKGIVYFVGNPVYDSAQQSLVVHNLHYDLQTRDFLLKTAQWLYNKRIINELSKYTSFNLSQYYDTASKTLNTWLNKEWRKGMQSSGSVAELKLTDVFVKPQHLIIRSNCTGNLTLKINELNWAL
ncbi:DUF4403 family protein [Chitinophagaceae bacterium LB-8]|uniref:DUF4403 family protein n=1 Tax=Paraflavisolibacter caeni TaxID=2982496 RepID=A0A9X3BJR6_9BACT|nr:DUF4403 family protein [Paraflavisolibacter caeni]MCU7551573.1 DUF4403 family protein [Paraflavisolibacter caeni]